MDFLRRLNPATSLHRTALILSSVIAGSRADRDRLWRRRRGGAAGNRHGGPDDSRQHRLRQPWRRNPHRRLVHGVPHLRGCGRGVQQGGRHPRERRVLRYGRRLREVLPRRDPDQRRFPADPAVRKRHLRGKWHQRHRRDPGRVSTLSPSWSTRKTTSWTA